VIKSINSGNLELRLGEINQQPTKTERKSMPLKIAQISKDNIFLN
jgi:hypothetical protein